MYSLGWTLWELASRRIPFHNATSNELILLWVQRGEREDIPEDCPARLASIIKDCWHGDPTGRPEAATVALLLRPGDAQGNISAECSVPAVATLPPTPPNPCHMIFYRANVCCIDTSPEKNSGGERMIGYSELSI